jgi:hypothetical protein
METVAERTEKKDVSTVNERALSMCTTHPGWDGIGWDVNKSVRC